MSISQRIRKQLEQPNGLTQEKLEPLAAEYAAAVALHDMHKVRQVLSYYDYCVRFYCLANPAVKCLIHKLNSLNHLSEIDPVGLSSSYPVIDDESAARVPS